MKARNLFSVLLLLLGTQAIYAQGVVISSDPGAVADPSAMLEVKGVTGTVVEGGIMVPRMTQVQREAITATAAEGLWVYQTDNLRGNYVYNGTAWMRLGEHQAVAGTVNVNDVTGAQVGYTPSAGFISAQVGGAGSGEFDITFTGAPFMAPPTVILTGNTYPPISGGSTPSDYCTPDHINNCVPWGAADYIDDMRLISTHGLTGVTAPTATGPISFVDNNTGCNNTPGNYVDNFNTIEGTVYGPNIGTGGYPGSSFTIVMQSGPEWADDLFAFIDYNQDGDFEDTGEAVFEAYIPGNANDAIFTLTNTVPATAVNGVTVLRAMTLYTEVVPWPCGTEPLPWGETQDYKLNVVGGGSTTGGPPRGSICNVSNVSTTGFKVFCSDLSENRAATTFHFYASEY